VASAETKQKRQTRKPVTIQLTS